MNEAFVTVVIGVVMVIGLFGTVIPVLPGLIVQLAAVVLFGFEVGFGRIGIVVVALIALGVVASVIKGVLLPRKMAQGQGVPLRSQLVAVGGGIVGFFTIPFVGVIVGALLGLFVAELVRRGTVQDAWAGVVAVLKGFGASAAIDFALGVGNLALWSGWALAVLW